MSTSDSRIAEEANARFGRADITARWVADVRRWKGWSIWEIDQWISRQIAEQEDARS